VGVGVGVEGGVGVGVEVGVVGAGVGVEGKVGFEAEVELFEDDPDPQAHKVSNRPKIRSASVHLFFIEFYPSSSRQSRV
jgi:hypothetical protein